MIDKSHDDLADEIVAKTRRILHRAKQAPPKEQLKGLITRGIIDQEGNVGPVKNGRAAENGSSHT